jgi:hypothetical protein
VSDRLKARADAPPCRVHLDEDEAVDTIHDLVLTNLGKAYKL